MRRSAASGLVALLAVSVAVLVSASHPAYASAPEVAATVDPEKETVPVRIVLARGGKIEGRALYRDGRAFVGGRVSCYPMDPRAGGMRWDTAAIDADGSVVIDHVPAGRTIVTLMAFTPASPMVSGSSANILTAVAAREVEVCEGETSPVDLSLRDVVVAGRVTRGGQPEPGVLVSVMVADGGSSVMAWGGSSAGHLASTGPAPLAGTSRDDGSYELLVFTPGPAHVALHGAGQRFPGREVDIPDTDRFELDLDVGGATVSGIVVDRDGGAPVAGASVGLRKEDGTGGSGGESSPDGRFSIAIEPGEYRLEARARDRQPASQNVTVGASGVSDIRVEMERGLEIRGRLVDTAGRPASGYLVVAAAADGDGSGHDSSGVDGAFRIGGLASKPHAIVGGSELGGYAFRPGVTRVPGGRRRGLGPGRSGLRPQRRERPLGRDRAGHDRPGAQGPEVTLTQPREACAAAARCSVSVVLISPNAPDPLTPDGVRSQAA
jgi:hypothetical protein